jgi:hypothetical protein
LGSAPCFNSRRATKSDATKRSICRILVKASKSSLAAARFIQSSLDAALLLSKHHRDDDDSYKFILNAGLNPIGAMYRAIFGGDNKDDGRGDPYLCGGSDEEHAI